MDCDCHNISEFSSEGLPELPPEEISYTIDFGKVVIGTKAHRTYTIKNDSQITMEYLVQRNPDRNPIYQVFDFHYNAKVPPKQNFECKITYKPLFAFDRCVDNLYIYGTYEDTTVKHSILLKGESVGPVLQTSSKYLNFYCNPNKRTYKQCVELTNSSDVELKYQIDINVDPSDLFDIDRRFGTIPAEKSVYLTITFKPKEYGCYKHKISCLILHHAPRVFYTVGIYTEDETLEEIRLKHIQQDISHISGFLAYLYTSLKVMKVPPLFSLSETYLDFGSVHLDHNKNNSRTLVTSLTNHMLEEIKVTWHNELSIFTILPNPVRVPAKQSVLFECQYSPRDTDLLNARIMIGNITWKDMHLTSKDTALVPLVVELRLLGNSFPENKRWIPQISIPEKVTLPVCTPNSASYTTFLIEATGYLPVSYKFLPPKNTNYIVHPMVGVVKNFQIVVAQLQADSTDKKVYFERWNVQLNGMETKTLPLFLNGYSEKPSIVIGNCNVVNFPAIYPGCREFLTVAMKNTSVHTLKYEFHLEDTDKKFLEICYATGTIVAHETVYMEWGLSGYLNTPPRKKVICELRPTQKDEIYGEQLDVPVQVITEYCYSQLCSMPNNWDIGEIQIGVQHTKKFYLFNFGESTINFNLSIKSKNKKKVNMKTITIVPGQGTVCPRGRSEIMLCVNPRESGSFHLHISYQIRISKNSFEIVDARHYHKIFDLIFTSVYPLIQIEDILDNNYGIMFCKTRLLEQLNIRGINHHLRTMVKNENRSVEMMMPDYEMNDGTFFAILVLQNVSNFNTYVKFKRNKICDCRLVEKPKGFTFRTNVYDCKHRDMFEMNLSGEEFEPHERRTVTINVKHFEAGLVNMSYILEFSNSRILIINVHFNTWAEKVEHFSKYQLSHHFFFSSVYLKERDPPIQAIWFYNNSASNIRYNLSEEQLHQVELENAYPVVECINPRGYVPPYSTVPIMFIFQPISAKKYRFDFNLTNGRQECKVSLMGKGIMVPKITPVKPPFPRAQHNLSPASAIELSQSHVIVEPFPSWCISEIIIFVKNVSKDRIIGYSFQRCIVEGIVEIKAPYNKGVLHAKESHAVRIEIKSFDQGFQSKLQLPCKFLDHTQYFRHKTSTIAYNLRQEEIKEQFIITENGISYAENDVIVEPMPGNFYKTLCLEVNIVSLRNMNIYLPTEKQMNMSSQPQLKLDYEKILKNIKMTVDPKKRIEHPIKSFLVDKMNNDIEAKYASEVVKEKENTYEKQIIKDSLENFLRDLLYCNLFEQVWGLNRELDPPYYIQIKSENYNKGQAREEFLDRYSLVQRFIDVPEPQILSAVLRELIADSFHEIFQLGPQVKKRIHLENVYEKKFKSKYTCAKKRCGCDELYKTY